MEIELSVVIVNYNVSYFLEQCLLSVQRAMQHVNTEVFVVDNKSSDESVEMVRDKFDWVHVIANQDNVGFSKANNQAIKISKGKYVLLLNPDTVIEEYTFKKVCDFINKTPDAGGLGVKMIDGKGLFLPESKRSLPTPTVSFYKIFGLSSLFPKSEKYGKYHLAYLDKDKTHEIDVLSGAFMLMRKETLDKCGLLDETFFMYGEDIDLSYRIQLAGYKNYYFSDTTIIHYKGESTKKGSINYVLVFYKAMIIFAKKHFALQYLWLFSLLIYVAVYLRAFGALVSRMIKNLIVPFVDAAVIGGAFYITHTVYTLYSGTFFPDDLIYNATYLLPIVWVISLFLSGGYDRPFQLKYITRGNLAATFLLFGIYAFLSESFRFSRLVMVSSISISWISIYAIRTIFNMLPFKGLKLKKRIAKRIGVVGDAKNKASIQDILNQNKINYERIFNISPSNERQKYGGYISSLNNIESAVKDFKINELIFSGKDVSNKVIIDLMERLSHQKIEFKIAPVNSEFIIGSNSLNTSGEFYSLLNKVTINQTTNRRNKRIFDIFTSVILILLSPIHIFFQKNKLKAIATTMDVITGKLSWVGYCNDAKMNVSLPKIKIGVFTPANVPDKPVLLSHEIEPLNIEYAVKYSVVKDAYILINNLLKI